MAVLAEQRRLDLRQRRDALFEAHSVLRSVDSLRPDEAFDELVKLYYVWLSGGLGSFAEARELEPDLRLSKRAFERSAEILAGLLGEGRNDTGADLFQELADVGVRAGLGQYFTPLPVARAMALYLSPRPGERWLDPFCGSGLLLGELARVAAGPLRLFGVDRDPRVLRLARLEASMHHPDSPLATAHGNALWPLDRLAEALDQPATGFDGVVTNPPFGAGVHRDDAKEYAEFELLRKGSTPLEILGLERAVEMLRPGGWLGIVLPQSVFSNRGSATAREYLLDTCHLDAVLSLPPDTFGPFKGVGKAAVLFATKRPSAADEAPTRFAVARQVGWDGAGRATAEEDITATAEALAAPAAAGVSQVRERDKLVRNLSPEWHLRPQVSGTPLRELSRAVFTGRSPGRAAYVAGDAEPEESYRVLKVANLTGAGVDWSPGDRGFARFSRPVTTKLLELGDLVLTAAAHHPRYIGAKVDVVDTLPEGHEERVLPCAEVMVIRPDPGKVDAVALLLWLRSEGGRAAVQACVTGQTAHLYPQDVADIVVPDAVTASDHAVAVELVERSLRLRRESEAAAAAAKQAFSADLDLP
jgi:type I restriction enzyme M protein